MYVMDLEGLKYLNLDIKISQILDFQTQAPSVLKNICTSITKAKKKEKKNISFTQETIFFSWWLCINILILLQLFHYVFT